MVRQLPPELRGPVLGRLPRPSDWARRGGARAPRRLDRQGIRIRRAGRTARRGEGGRRPDRHLRRHRGPGGVEAIPRGGREGLLLLRADVPGPPARPELPGGGQGRPCLRDAEGRNPRGPDPEEGADAGLVASGTESKIAEKPTHVEAERKSVV